MRWIGVLVLAACGRIGFDPLVPPFDPSNSALTSGDQFSCAIAPNRNVLCWGDGRRGQLANGELAVKATVVATPIANAQLIDAGLRHACALLGDGRLLCWGDNSYFQLGIAGVAPRPDPVDVAGLPAPVEQLALGANHTCVILTDKSLWCWGRNNTGELGIPIAGNVSTPTHVLDDVVQASGGEGFTCALRGDHSVWCWGINTNGQLGDSTFIDRATPRAIPAFVADSVSVGDKHACAVVGGRYTCWGLNNNGELGDGTNIIRPMPGTLSVLANIVQLDAGNDHNCALLEDTNVVCWGYNEDGAVGAAFSSRYETKPIEISIRPTIQRVSSGGQHSCAQRDDGSVSCWGYASNGQLANGIRAEWVPRQVSLPSAAGWVSAGDEHVCAALTPTGEVYCWGDNLYGQLGHGGTEPASATPVRAQALTGVGVVAAAGKFTCTAGGTAYCWGANANGQLADGTMTKRVLPAMSMFGNTTGFAGGNQFMCARTTAGTALCAGIDDRGQLGDGGGVDRDVPFQIPLANVTNIAAGANHACVLLANNTVSCWGDNRESQLGIGTRTASELPKAVAGTFTAVHGGGDHTCGVQGTGNLACWGNNNFGELGDGTKTDRTTPTTIAIPGAGPVDSFGLGEAHTCATRAGNLYCWGPNENGELGDGTGVERLAPQLVGAMALTGVAAGERFTCALDTAGSVWCWGDNNRGQIGQGTMTRSLTAIEINFP
jgi:alpha-tubulin suppressor-like RCC1 family protein